jgi:hypothetical protein
MKRIVFTFICISFFTSYFAQKVADKKIQAGLVTGIGLNFTNPTTKYISRNGIGKDLTIGMNFNYNYTSTIGISSGIEFDFETIKFNTDSTLYYLYNDSEILSKSQYANTDNIFKNSESKVYQITSRKEKPIYLSIPTMFLFRTEFIGSFRYFGKFGLRNSFLLGSTIYDEGYIVENNSLDNKLSLSSMKNGQMKGSNRNLSYYKGNIGLCGGTEWNFSGTTSLVFELGYYYGFLNISRGNALTGDDEKNMSIITNLDNNKKPSKFNNFSAKQNQLLFKVSILF